MIPQVPPSFKMTRPMANNLAVHEQRAIDELLAGRVTDDTIDMVRSMAKDAVRTAQRARSAPHTRGVLDKDALDEAERVGLAMLKTVHLIEADGVTENNKAVLRVFNHWVSVMNKEIPRAVWLAATKPPRRKK